MATPDEIGEFLDFMWGTQEVDDEQTFAHVRTSMDGKWNSFSAVWPKQRETVIQTILRFDAEGRQVFFAPALFNSSRAVRANVKGSWVLWVDFDGNAPEDWPQFTPSLRVQSSGPRNQHVYWALEEFLTDKDVLEDRNRALAMYFGADSSGWDAGQILRPIGTTNRKPGKGDPQVHLLTPIDPEKYKPLSEYAVLPSVERVIEQELEDIGDLPDIDSVRALAVWTEEQYALFVQDMPEKDRSGALTQLAYNGAEARWTDEQILAVLLDADRRWKKYSERHNQLKILTDIVAIARNKYGYDWTAPEAVDFEELFSRTKNIETGDDWYALGDFLDRDFPIDWLLEGLMDRQGLGLITGYPGVGKTQLALNFAYHLAAGKDWLRFPLNGGRRRVLFLSLEMAREPLQQFTSTIIQGEDYVGIVELVRENVYVLPAGQALSLDLPAGREYLKLVLDAVQPDVVVIDSLQRIASKPLTDEVAVKELDAYLSRLRSDYNCGLVFIHHNRKKTDKAQVDNEADLSEMFGSTFIAANATWVMSLRKGSVDAPELLRLDHIKNRLGPERQPAVLTRTEHLNFHYDGDAAGLMD